MRRVTGIKAQQAHQAKSMAPLILGDFGANYESDRCGD
jgi:hypothetical protein